MTLTMAAAGHAGRALASDALTSTHGAGFCSLNLLLAHADQPAQEDGLEIQFVDTPTVAEQVTFLGIGQADVGLTPYTSFMALHDAGAPVTIVAGGGIAGCGVDSQPVLDSAEKPAALKALIKGMMQAQAPAENDPDVALGKLVGTYCKTSMENAELAKVKQPAVVVARSQTDVSLDRVDGVIEMGYIKRTPGRDAIDGSLPEAVIAENGPLYDSRKPPPPHIFLGDIDDHARFFTTATRWAAGVNPGDGPTGFESVPTTVMATLARVVAGLAMASALALTLGVLIRCYVAVERLTLPTILLLSPVSPIAWLPVAIFPVGIGNAPAIVMVVVALFFHMVIATVAPIDNVNRKFSHVARTMGATRRQVYARVIIPAILPGLLIVLRLNLFAP